MAGYSTRTIGAVIVHAAGRTKMTTHLQPYATYKPSGVTWFADVPEHWDVRRLKVAAAIVAGQSPPSAVVFEYSDYSPFLQGNAEFGVVNPTPRLACERASKWAGAGDILLSVRAPVGAINIADQIYGIGRGLCAIEPGSDLTQLFAYYTLMIAKMDLKRVSTGSTYDAVTVGDVGSLRFPIPPLPEQHAIVRFLDYVNRRIRRYVSAKRKLIALLEGEKQAIVHRAVTRGLDPNVRLKPSGVEWLGDVPEHWEVRRIKSLSLVKRGASPRPIADPVYFEDNGEYAWVRILDVTASSRYLERTTQRLSRRGQSLSVALQPGALFLSIAGSVGKPIITKVKCCIHDGFVYFPQFRGNAEFLYRVFSCGAPFAGLGKLGTQLNLNTDTVGSICLGWPAFSEQAAIVEYLDKATAAIDEAISRAHRQIELVQEYRTRLIADVVTGKLDVREAAAQLPDEPDDEEPHGRRPLAGG